MHFFTENIKNVLEHSCEMSIPLIQKINLCGLGKLLQ